MKRVIVIFLLSLLVLRSAAQTTSLTKEYYFEKSKKQKKTGWIMLGGGAAMAIIGAVNFNSSWDSGSNSSTDISGFAFLGGVLSALISIPIFISASSNYKKAFKLGLETQSMSIPVKGGQAQLIRPALTIRLNIR